MKKYIIAVFCAALALASCTQTSKVGSEYLAAPDLEVSKSTLTFTSEGGSQAYTVNSKETVEVTMAIQPSWIKVNVNGNTVVVTVTANQSIETRYAILKTVSGGAERRVQVVQFGSSSKYIWEPSYDVDYKGGSFTLGVPNTEETVKFNVSDEWISAELGTNEVVVTVAANPLKEVRSGYVTWKAGDVSMTTVVNQAANPNGQSGDDPDNPDNPDNPDDPDNPDNPDNPDEPGDVSFQSWIGSWTATTGETLTITEGDATQGVLILSYSGFAEGQQNVPAFYNEETGAMEFYTYKLGEKEPYTYYFCAKDSEDYIEMGGPESDIMLASATLNAGGNGFTVTGNEYQAVYDGTTYDEVIVALLVCAYNSEDGKFYTFQGFTEWNLPSTFNKSASGSSVKANSAKTFGLKGLKYEPAYTLNAR